MSKADKMFEELGYKKIENQFIDVIELWGNDDDKRLSFEADKTICMSDFYIKGRSKTSGGYVWKYL